MPKPWPEKPLAMNSNESRELVKLAEKAGVVHAIDFNYRYMPLVQQARAVTAELAKNAFHNVAYVAGTFEDLVAGLGEAPFAAIP